MQRRRGDVALSSVPHAGILLASAALVNAPRIDRHTTLMPESYSSESSRRSTRAEMMKRAIADHVTYTLALEPAAATDRDYYKSPADAELL